ncbi:Pentatricopeptide repeat-containing protein [Artemisia annua]|uniref:Pentatricopeptide repeat-containing protein n=1 Tax=Artemisia annua TaxID=35608 RepID=A0A2U1Q0X8_ARTAN|nr:Pentatricopeptide repeat-containing protein [Artemisia annua]
MADRQPLKMYQHHPPAKSVSTLLISMYSIHGFMDDANIVFETTIKKDTVSWNAMIVAQGYHGSASKALSFCKKNCYLVLEVAN